MCNWATKNCRNPRPIIRSANKGFHRFTKHSPHDNYLPKKIAIGAIKQIRYVFSFSYSIYRHIFLRKLLKLIKSRWYVGVYFPFYCVFAAGSLSLSHVQLRVLSHSFFMTWSRHQFFFVSYRFTVYVCISGVFAQTSQESYFTQLSDFYGRLSLLISPFLLLFLSFFFVPFPSIQGTHRYPVVIYGCYVSQLFEMK